MPITQQPYHPNTAKLFAHLYNEPWAVFLDSTQPYNQQGRFDIVSAKPRITLVTRGLKTEIREKNNLTVSYDDPFLLLKDILLKAPKQQGSNNVDIDIPFHGGAIGYFSYDLSRRIESLATLAEKDIDIPEMAIGIYDWAFIVDHHQQRSYLVTQNDNETSFPNIENSPLITPTPLNIIEPFRSNMTKKQYADAFERIMEYIINGDCYEANLTQRFVAPTQGSPWDAYLKLRQRNPAPFSAFMNMPDVTLMSCSPERFLEVRDRMVETKPIKGTHRRGKTLKEDKKLAVELLASEKDRAENLMIVDLMRHDLGKNCEIGSVKVPKLFQLESFASVHHLVSTVTGKLAHHKHSLDLLRGCFPGGSITGAPKLRVMEIIEALEPHRRAVYCGSIGYIDFNGDMDCNIAIRTVMHHNNQVYCSAGGALVADSKLDAEYQETFDKVDVILKTLSKPNLD